MMIQYLANIAVALYYGLMFAAAVGAVGSLILVLFTEYRRVKSAREDAERKAVLETITPSVLEE